MAVRRCKKEDLKRIARATGATVVVSLANLEGEESFDASLLGTAESVVQERVCDDELIIVKGCVKLGSMFQCPYTYTYTNHAVRREGLCMPLYMYVAFIVCLF